VGIVDERQPGDNEEVQALREQIKAKDDEIALLKNDVSTKDDEIASLKNDVSTKDDEIASLKNDVSTKDNLIAALGVDNAAKDKELNDIKAEHIKDIDKHEQVLKMEFVDQLDARIAKKDAEMQLAHDQKMAEAKLDHEENLTEAYLTCGQGLTDAQRAHDQGIAKLRDEIAKAKQTHEQQMNTAKTAHEREMKNAMDALERANEHIGNYSGSDSVEQYMEANFNPMETTAGDATKVQLAREKEITKLKNEIAKAKKTHEQKMTSAKIAHEREMNDAMDALERANEHIGNYGGPANVERYMENNFKPAEIRAIKKSPLFEKIASNSSILYDRFREEQSNVIDAKIRMQGEVDILIAVLKKCRGKVDLSDIEGTKTYLCNLDTAWKTGGQ
jgi:chromosome segregation ATPase